MKEKMPMVFTGHGSPMNAVEENRFSKGWEALGRELPRPKAILAVSSHWVTDGVRLSPAEKPRMVYDMYGFPEALYEVQYPAPGAPALARRAAELLGGRLDDSWGLDHGVWSVLRRMFPDAGIPVVEMSVDAGAAPEDWFKMGQKLRPLREEGVLLLASGNVVHNLSLLDWDRPDGYAWADAFDAWVRDRILNGRYGEVLRWQDAGESAAKAFHTPEHFAPLLVALGAAEGDSVKTRNEARTMGSLSMTCYLFQSDSSHPSLDHKGE
jgi:4,5-DOPA dioxygenase extradiol